MNKPSIDTNFLPTDDADPAGYENDVVLWFEQQVELLRTGQFNRLDLGNLIEELEAMPARDRRELRSRLEVLLIHLLKFQFQPEHRCGSWLGTISGQRSEIAGLLKQSPSLRREVQHYADSSYANAVFRASSETGLPKTTFPTENPFDCEQLLDLQFLP